MTHATILAEVIEVTGRSELTDILSEINVVLDEITSDVDILKVLEATITTEANTKSYSFAADVKKLIGKIRDDNGYDLDEREYAWLDKNRNDTGEPTEYAVQNSKVIFSDIPDTVYIFYYDYVKLHTKLTAVGGTIELPDYCWHCVIEGVCYQVYKRKGQAASPSAREHRVNYLAAKNKLSGHIPDSYEPKRVRYNDI